MKKKKIIIFVVGVLTFILTFIYAIYVSSVDNLNNKRAGYENKYVFTENMHFENWKQDEEKFISENDPIIIINDIDTYVHTIKINGEFKVEDKIKVYYEENSGDGFIEERSLDCEYTVVNGYPMVTVDKYVSSLRIDLTENAGFEAKIFGAEINDRSLVWSAETIVTRCVFPSVIIIIILTVLLLGKQISDYISVFKKYTALLKNLVTRDLKVKYRRSFLGFLWSVLNPLLMAFIINAVFSHLFRFQVEYFIIYYLLGSVMFNFMTEATIGAMMSVINAGGLIKKVYIPKYVFPMEKCIFAFINMLFSITAIIVMILVVRMPVNSNALLFFVPMLYTAVFSLGIGLILASLTVFFRDIEHLYTVFVSAWIYLTPVIYPEDILSDRLKSFMKFNPMYYYVGYFRSVVMYGEIPSLSMNVVCMAFSLGFLALGLFIFKRFQDRFVLYI